MAIPAENIPSYYSFTMPSKHQSNLLRGPKLRILVAPAGFKEALGPEAVASALKEGLRRVVDRDTATIVKLPLHDGGEGFCKALVASHGGEIRDITVTGPVGEPVRSYYGLIGSTAVLDSKARPQYSIKW